MDLVEWILVLNGLEWIVVLKDLFVSPWTALGYQGEFADSFILAETGCHYRM
jgi:hypothetical protein